ncbi:MAG: LysM peptidoglycan-binding domain-containing protein [Lachnospiraceae bacterium]|nr:LysM peptidoglycan-binding domain-containing protein [Lachnospiraceae bacterium]
MKKWKRRRRIIQCMVLTAALTVSHTQIVAASEKEKTASESSAVTITVEDDGRELPDNEVYSGLTCNMKKTYSEDKYMVQEDGSIQEEEVFTMHLNNIWISVPIPDGGSRTFGVPIFSTDIKSETEWKEKEKIHDVTGEDCPEFNDGIETARRLILEGYLQKPLERFLARYPEINPEEREYTLRLIGGGRTDRLEDDTSWWDLDYVLTTIADDGEVIPVITIDITKVTKAQGWECFDDAHYRMWSAENGIWRLQEEASLDLGKVWISQLPEEDFSVEEEVRAYVEEQGAGFDCLLPSGADTEVDWSWHKEEGYWYDYLVWSGSTATYDLTLAIPLMEEGAGGWYMASRIRREATDKETCRHTLSGMMQTFHAERYVHKVRGGESLWSIYKNYEGQDAWEFSHFIMYSNLKNPNLIYPGQNIDIPWI